MTMKILVEECIVCGACEPECPNEAISHTDSYLVDALKCTECVGAYDTPCCVEVCPIDGCIDVDADHRESREELRLRYERLHTAG